jgi:hypothetical protein
MVVVPVLKLDSNDVGWRINEISPPNYANSKLVNKICYYSFKQLYFWEVCYVIIDN